MIKALLLIFDPLATWEGIARTRRSVGFILVVYLLPILILTAAGEGFGLVRWGRERGRVSQVRHVQTFTVGQAVVFETGQLALSLLVVFACATMVKSIGETFHGRHTFQQSFTAVAYGLGPLFLFRLLDAFPLVNPWVSWSIGIILTIATLYQGLPRMMEPDPSHALGLFFMTGLVLILCTGLLRFLTYWYLIGSFNQVEVLVNRLAEQLPFK